jgi:glycosyltransferase involved in cell wall biosynthesis
MEKLALAHFAPITLDTWSGMGRVAVHWRDALVRRGWSFRHFGSEEVPLPRLKPLWAISARRAWKKAGGSGSVFLAHEPSAETVRNAGLPTVLFSHGLEARCADIVPVRKCSSELRLQDWIMLPFWRWRTNQTEQGLRNCPLLLLINQDDRTYAMDRYRRRAEDIFVFRNGVDFSPVQPEQMPSGIPTVLFYGSWLERKGKSVLVGAASKLAENGCKLRWLLIGTGKSESEVLADWPVHLRDSVEVKPHVDASDDDAIYLQATVFVLPSFFEGQPLTLLQAMESGRCVVTTRSCGQKDIVEHGRNGLLVEPGDVNEFAEQIANAVKDSHQRLALGRQAKKDMASRRWPVVSDEVVDRLEHFMRERSDRV